MNLMPARLASEGGVPHLHIGEQKLEAQALLAGLQSPPNDGTSAILGVRPEDVTVLCDAGLRATVLATEPLGAETLLTLELVGSDKPLRARVDRDLRPAKGDRIGLRFDLSRASLFRADTGAALPHRA